VLKRDSWTPRAERAEEEIPEFSDECSLTGLAKLSEAHRGIDAESKRYGRSGRPFAVLCRYGRTEEDQ